ncbi:hypothetical protein BWQ96_01940 [Gracilariopsis chorda]|uniref:Uncharacterized protein n=1 Tax=Gracilariopsis chorda TaxID=448386 RepID=A0A2V3J1F7_9FLOR|nr:hypothetical protein BWQ96_01940 [Gracilariopsis chorda]|eukprot:PXF48251.1 hypothetical protein BWQ96_01940 [Gracilariopsis chorda]
MDTLTSLRQRAQAVKNSLDEIHTDIRRSTPSSATHCHSAGGSATPALRFLAASFEKVEPIAESIAHAISWSWTTLHRYHGEDALLAMYGVLLVFFGGVYMTLVACFEAAYQFGWQRIKKALQALYIEWSKARRALLKHSKIDDNRDGIADVKQMDATQLAMRRMVVLSRSVDPEQVSAALEGVCMATVAILATVRVRFGRALTIGTAIGDVLHDTLSGLSTRLLRYALSEEYEKWIPVLNRYGFRYVGVCMGWMMVRLVTALYAAMRGSVLLTRAVQSYLVRHGYVRRQAVEVEQGSARMIALCGALAATGVYWQLSGSFTVGFPLNVILVPVTVAEGVVTFVVAAAG